MRAAAFAGCAEAAARSRRAPLSGDRAASGSLLPFRQEADNKRWSVETVSGQISRLHCLMRQLAVSRNGDVSSFGNPRAGMLQRNVQIKAGFCPSAISGITSSTVVGRGRRSAGVSRRRFDNCSQAHHTGFHRFAIMESRVRGTSRRRGIFAKSPRML